MIVARELLGKLLIRRVGKSVTCGRIVETEAYLPTGDSACHAAQGENRKNQSMFAAPATAYVYVIHARYCFNVVTEALDTPAAVLVRALEPLVGVEVMQRRRGKRPLEELARGPAKLCEALRIDRSLDGWDLTRGEKLWLAEDNVQFSAQHVQQSPRIGVTSAKDLQLRFYLRGNRFVSKIPKREWRISADD